MRRLLAWLMSIGTMAAIALALGYYKYSEIQAAIAGASMMPEPAETVETVTPHLAPWVPASRAIGTVVAIREVELRNEIAGTIAEVNFASGDIVEAGQVLVQFGIDEEMASLRAAEADEELARLTYERRARLSGGSVISEQDIDASRMQFAAATARTEALEAAIAKRTLRAPFRARVGLVDLQPGAYLEAGSTIAMLQGVDDDVFVDFALPQDQVATLAPGVAVTLRGPQIPGGSAEAEIVAADASVDAANRTVRFRVRARGLGEVVRPGAFVDVVAATASPSELLFVPQTAVRHATFGTHVFVIADEGGQLRARVRVVRLGPVMGADVAVIEGLAEGDTIAGAGSFKLREGLLIYPAAAEAAGGPAEGAVEEPAPDTAIAN